jgi:hypothetical protein
LIEIYKGRRTRGITRGETPRGQEEEKNSDPSPKRKKRKVKQLQNFLSNLKVISKNKEKIEAN